MKVRTRIFALVTGASAVFLVAAITLVRVESDRAMEMITNQKEERYRYTKRIVQLRGESLETYARDYTVWDEMGVAIAKADRKWLEGNLTTSYDTYGSEAVWVYNTSRKAVYQHAVHDAEGVAPQDISWVLKNPPKSGKTWHFFIQTDKGPMEIRGSTVHGTTDLDRKTAPTGYFFAGRMWTRGFLGKLEEVADASITLSPTGSRPPDSLSDGLFFSSIPLPGFNGKPADHAIFATKRQTWSMLYDSGRRSIVGYLAYAAVLLGTLAFCLYRWVSRPLRAIASSLESDRSEPLDPVKSKDEFGEIASLIRAFFRQRSELKAEVRSRELAERELRSSLAEVLETRRLAVNQARMLESQTIQLEGARDAALEAVRQKGEFLAYMSHEIRNPLGGIKGVADLLLDTSLDTRQRDYTRTIGKSAESLLEMLDGILDLSKAENGKIELEEIEFCLEDVIDEVGDLMAPRALDKGIEFDVYVDPAVPDHLKGDPGRIRQVVTNLVSNAIKFTESGHVDVDVICGSVADGVASVEIAVRDTGVGIPADRLDAVFEQYTQAESSTTRRFGGTGLGLSISKQLVELMGGSITVDSVVGRGTTFTVRLPLPALMPAERSGDAQLVGRGFRLLVLGPDSTFRRRLVGRLEHCGFGVVATSDAGAIDTGERPHAAIVDDDGLGAARDRVLSRLVTTGMPHVRIQSRSDSESADSAISVGLTRPVRTSDLIAAIEQVLKGVGSGVAGADEPGRPLEGVRVLVAEDDRVNQMVAQRILDDMGCQTTIVGNGRQAVEAVRARRWDIVFMDCHMPEMGGIEATSEIRALEGDLGWRVPIVALSATSTLEEQEQCLAWGMDDFLVKPASAAKMMETILRWVPGLRRAA